MNTFEEDLKTGKAVEHEICKLIQKKYPKAYVIEHKEKGFDIVIPEMKVEVKYDEVSEKTGNYLIEIEHDGKPSGLLVTVADWWVIVNKQALIWIKTEKLKNIVEEYKKISYIAKGDTKSKKAYLIPRDRLMTSVWVTVQKRI